MTAPVFSHTVAGVVLDVFVVDSCGQAQYQLYAGENTARWELVGMFSEPVDVAAAIGDWHNYLAGGGTLDAWSEAHPDGITPKISRKRAAAAPDGTVAVVVCTCVLNCSEDDPDTPCWLDGEWHTHPLTDGPGFGPCPLHPDAPAG